MAGGRSTGRRAQNDGMGSELGALNSVALVT